MQKQFKVIIAAAFVLLAVSARHNRRLHDRRGAGGQYFYIRLCRYIRHGRKMGRNSSENKILYPDRIIPKDPAVTNTGTVNLYVYLEVHVPIRSVRTVSEDKTDIIPSRPQELFSYTVNPGWCMVDEYTAEDGSFKAYVYAYAEKALAPGETSGTLFDSVHFLNILEGELDMDSNVTMPVYTYGIQSNYIETSGSSAAERLESIYTGHKSELRTAFNG